MFLLGGIQDHVHHWFDDWTISVESLVAALNRGARGKL